MAATGPSRSDCTEKVPVIVVAVPFPAQGHLNPLLSLSTLISSFDIPVHYIGSATHMIARCDLDDATVQTILQQVVDKQQDLASVAKAIGATTKEDMAADIGVPMHPGAEAFWQEQGVL